MQTCAFQAIRAVRSPLGVSTKRKYFPSGYFSRTRTWREYAAQSDGTHDRYSRGSPTTRQKNERASKGFVPDIQSGLEAHTILRKKTSLWLRDICSCSQCVDSSTRQKLFQTCDLPLDVKAQIIKESPTSFEVRWANDIPEYQTTHRSTYQKGMLIPYLDPSIGRSCGFVDANPLVETWLWDKVQMEQAIESVVFDDYLANDASVWTVLKHLKAQGLVLLRGLPSTEDAIEQVASRIGHLRETFYGRTWDVKSVPQAKNVAYTNQFLGFHMDLLYMSDPPGLQMLHCLKNTCDGGTSMFADGFKAAQAIKNSERERYRELTIHPQKFQYENSGESYHFERPVVELDDQDCIKFVNWSPPFQGPFEGKHSFPEGFRLYVQAARSFASQIEAPENIYEYRMQEGDCVIFNNRRILHARQAFDTGSGERWLKGAYIDSDVFNSRFRVLSAGMQKS